MRNILFRGKEELTEYQINMGYKESKWVYGYYWTNEVGNHFIRVTRDEKQFYLFNDYEVIPETVGQFTGLTDKNGTKIFEGDILGCVDRIVRVNWNKENGLWDSEFLSYTHKPLCSNGIKAVDWKFRAEVIGNIHERENDE